MERDKNGRFVAGNGGGPGRPKKVREERFLEIMLAAVTFEDWRAIIKRAVTLARIGNKDARKFLADYILGPPVRRTEITGRDGGPVETNVQHGIDLSDYSDAEIEILAAGAERRRHSAGMAETEI